MTNENSPQQEQPGEFLPLSLDSDLETLNLDKGAFLISAFSDMERVARETAQP